MAVSYNGLWKLLIDKKMKKVDMMNQVGISSSTVAKMTNDELVSMKVLEKICEKLDCDFGDIVHYERKPQSETTAGACAIPSPRRSPPWARRRRPPWWISAW